jgi:hypothetical protein
MLRLEIQWFIDSLISVIIPEKGLSHEVGKNIQSPYKKHHADGRLTYKGVLLGSPAISTIVP